MSSKARCSAKVNRKISGTYKRKLQPKNEVKVRPKSSEMGMEQRTPFNVNLLRSRELETKGKINDQESEVCKLIFCPNCQVPFSSLIKDTSVKREVNLEQLHLNDCLDMDRRKLKACPQGISCDSTLPNHFYNFSHFQKAIKNAYCLDPVCNNGTKPERFSSMALPFNGQDSTINETDMTDTSLTKDLIFDKISENFKSTCIFEKSEIKNRSLKETVCMPTTLKPEVCHDDQEDTPASLHHRECSSLNEDFRHFAPSSQKYLDSYHCATTSQINNNDSSGFCDDTLAVETISNIAQSEKQSYAPASDGRNICLVTTSKELIISSPKNKLQTKLTSFFLSANGKKPTKVEFTSSDCNRKRPQVDSISSQKKLRLEVASDNIVKNNNSTRTCPFYKKIPGTKFAVDAFSYGRIPDISHYFLSHFHYDHYQGLNKHFVYPLYCTKVTANLISLKIGVSQQYLFICPEDEPFIVDGVKIQLFDANHCPGSVMFLFSLLDGQNILHTGDFRATTNMMTHPFLSEIHTLYLDTTYLDVRYSFPSQDAVIKYVTDLVEKKLKRNPKTLFVCGSYTIGKERLFAAISKKSNLKIWASPSKHRILRCLEDDFLNANLITNWNHAQIHVLSMNLLNAKDLQKHLSNFEGIYTELLAIKPTGWTYQRSTANLNDIRPQNSGSVAVYNVPYSEHSSFLELKEFVQALHPKKIIPTVKSKNSYSEMNGILRNWLM